MTDELRELIERLRFERQTSGRHSVEGYGLTGIIRLQAMLEEAASALQSLSERNAELEGLLSRLLKWADRVQDGDNGVNYLNGEKPPFGDGADAWADLDVLRADLRISLTKGGK